MDDLVKKTQQTVLIVDDEKISLDIVEDILVDEGYQAITCCSGEECYTIAVEIKPDLVLLDINMPGIDGIETCRKLKKDAVTSEIPVIFMTASTEETVIEKAFESGCTDYISKPFRRVELLTRLRSALNNKLLREKLLEDEKFKGIIELAGSICHELNQPLHVIMGYADMMVMGTGKDSEIFRQAKIISEQAERMGNITEQLMNLTKTKTKKYIGNTNILDLKRSSNLISSK